MKILNFGALSKDYVYAVDHICRQGETIGSRRLDIFCGGKGLNQSIALARAGVPVFHAGSIGEDGDFLLEACRENGVDTTYVRKVDGVCGTAVIQVCPDGQNNIILYGGANHRNDTDFIDRVLANFSAGDMLLLQNEINANDHLINRSHAIGMTTVFNPSPVNDALKECDLSKISIFMINEIEGNQLTGESDPEKILTRMDELYPSATTVLTLGDKGAYHQESGVRIFQCAFSTVAVDTTAAGDTFCGYFIAETVRGASAADAMRVAAAASALAVAKPGASPSIPTMEQVAAKLENE